MPFSPDILLTDEDTPRILPVVQTLLHSRALKEKESQLKFYMTQMRCPIGLLITPDELEVFRQVYGPF